MTGWKNTMIPAQRMRLRLKVIQCGYTNPQGKRASHQSWWDHGKVHTSLWEINDSVYRIQLGPSASLKLYTKTDCGDILVTMPPSGISTVTVHVHVTWRAIQSKAGMSQIHKAGHCPLAKSHLNNNVNNHEVENGKKVEMLHLQDNWAFPCEEVLDPDMPLLVIDIYHLKSNWSGMVQQLGCCLRRASNVV